MAGHTTTRLHISGYRFLLHRMEHALVRGDARMADDPLRAQSLSLIGGAVIAVIIVAATAVLAFVRPAGALGDAPIVMVRDSGALYVRIGDVLHPALNLASARLIAGTPANPSPVSASAVSGAKRGSLVGIPGAPAFIAPPLGEDESGWAVCDGPTDTTVIAGRGHSQATEANVLVTPRSESAATTYLLFDGRRATVDLRNRAVVRALMLEGIAPQPVSRVLLDALPEVPPITPPHIPGAGSPGVLRGHPVGSVVRIGGDGDYYVVLAQGVQRVGRVAADLIRFTDSQRDRDIDTVAPDVIGAAPILDTLPVAAFPERGGASSRAVVCAHWRSGPNRVDTSVSVDDSLAVEGFSLAQADGDGPKVDAFAIARGRSGYVRSVGVTGDGASASYFVSDAGVVFGLRDEDTAKRLGLDGTPVPAPWPVLAWLPRGPELSVDAASVGRDGVTGPP
jgi:type VII secretion protein EccB